jgi:hypothetical protein
MIDNILYSTATRLGIRLLTLDDDLKKFALEKQLREPFISIDELTLLAKELREARGSHSN